MAQSRFGANLLDSVASLGGNWVSVPGTSYSSGMRFAVVCWEVVKEKRYGLGAKRSESARRLSLTWTLRVSFFD